MVRRLGAALAGGVVESALAKGVGTLKSFDPPLGELRGHTFTGMRRRSKLLIASFDGDLLLLVHLMSAARLQLYDKPGSLKDRTLRPPNPLPARPVPRP